MAIEIVDLPMKHGHGFNSKLLVYQRVLYLLYPIVSRGETSIPSLPIPEMLCLMCFLESFSSRNWHTHGFGSKIQAPRDHACSSSVSLKHPFVAVKKMDPYPSNPLNQHAISAWCSTGYAWKSLKNNEIMVYTLLDPDGKDHQELLLELHFWCSNLYSWCFIRCP